VGYTTITQGLTITVPTSGTKNWAQALLVGAWEKISAHDHTGGGNGQSLTSASLAPNFSLVQASLQTITGVGPHTLTIDFANGNIHLIDLTGVSAGSTVSVVLANPAAGADYKIFIRQPSAAITLSWPIAPAALIKWPQGQELISTTGISGAVDSVSLYYNSVDTVYYGDWQVNYS
jgi:hypothetical protein